MATQFKIPKINFANTPAGVQNFKFEYKLWNASAYTLINASVPVNPDGTLQSSPQLGVSGLTPGSLYYVRASNNCSSPTEVFVKQIQL